MFPVISVSLIKVTVSSWHPCALGLQLAAAGSPLTAGCSRVSAHSSSVCINLCQCKWPHKVQDWEEWNPKLLFGYYHFSSDGIQMGNALLTVDEIKKCVGFARTSRSSLCLTAVIPCSGYSCSWWGILPGGRGDQLLFEPHYFVYKLFAPCHNSVWLWRGADHLQTIW